MKKNVEDLEPLGNYHLLKYISKPEKVVQIVLFLADPQSGFLTWAANIDGGIGTRLYDPAVIK